MSGPANAPRLSPGNEIAGRFRLLSPVENALVGERWRADDGGVIVHLTLLTARSGLSASERDTTLSALRDFGHPHGVPVFDAGLHQGQPYVVSALPSGQSLRAWLADHKAREASVSFRDARGIFDQVTQYLAAAHRADVPLVHGASLVSSVYLERRGEVQLVATLGDLGLLMVGDAGSAPRPADADPDRPSVTDDIHGAGALLAELLAGVVVTGRPDPEALSANLTSARPDVDPSLWKIVTACLAPDASARPPTMARVREMIRQGVWSPRELRSTAREAPAVTSAPAAPTAPAAPERARIVAVSSTLDRSGPTPPPTPPAKRPAAAAAPPPPVAAPPPPVAVAAPPVAVSAPPVASPAPPVALPAPTVAVPAPPVPVATPPVIVAAPTAPVVAVPLPVAAPTLTPPTPVAVAAAPLAASSRSFASGSTEATVLVVDVPALTREAGAVVDVTRVTRGASHEVTRRASNPFDTKVAALPKAARALFDDESTTLHVSSQKGAVEDATNSDAHDVTPALGTRADETVERVALHELQSVITKEETAPEAFGFAIDALLGHPRDDAPTLLPLTREQRPATLAPPTPPRTPPAASAPPAPPPASVPSVISDAFLLPADAPPVAPRVATMAPPTARFSNAPLPAPAFFDDHNPSTMPVPVMPSPLPPPRPAPTYSPRPPPEPPSMSLLEPPLVWWLVAAVAGVVTLLAASLLTAR